MSEMYRRNAPKIGRNDPCHCGSRRKFKHCHGRPEYALPNLIAAADLEKQILAEGRRQLERHKATELQRQKQQGLGRPIISIEHKGFRFVAVANRLLYGKWKTFVDFLHDFIKITLGSDWGNAEIAKPFEERHPLLQWHDKVARLQIAHAGKPGELYSTPMTGAVSAYNRLAYNLYLIAHNGKDIQTRLLARLKNKENFQGAYYETQVAAWLIRAGFELEFENERDTSSSHCEFTATYMQTGEKYSVEAKARETRPGGSARTPVGSQLRRALTKRANHRRLVFIDLNKALHTQEAAARAADRAEFILRASEKMTIDGAPAPSAYVCITNMNDQHALDDTAIATMVSFVGFKLPDFMGNYGSLREAARARERHLPMFRLLKSIEEHREIPQTFGGELPSEVFLSDPRPRLRVGQLYLVPGPDGAEVPAELTQAVVAVVEKKAYGVLRDPKTGVHWIGTFEMTNEELQDYARHPETYFGVYAKQGKRGETGMDMYDFFADGYADTPKERLIELLNNYPDQNELKRLSRKELVEILAERYTYAVMARGFKPKTREEIRAERRAHGGPPLAPEPKSEPKPTKIRVDSDEYKCWHEVGHATVCLHLGGDVDSIEFLNDDARGRAVAHCSDVTPEIEKSVACGGFAAEVYLLKFGYAEKSADDDRDINRVPFHNATHDREEYWGRKLGSDEAFTEAEDKEFMQHAIGSDGYGGVIPIFNQHFSGMQKLVRELFDARKVEGMRVKELLGIGIPR
jgi:hypothetical protein